jgi:hypothetical protein
MAPLRLVFRDKRSFSCDDHQRSRFPWRNRQTTRVVGLFGCAAVALASSPAVAQAASPTAAFLPGIPVDFVLFALTLLGVALCHHALLSRHFENSRVPDEMSAFRKPTPSMLAARRLAGGGRLCVRLLRGARHSRLEGRCAAQEASAIQISMGDKV